MSGRAAMTMRAKVSRAPAASGDDWGNPETSGHVEVEGLVPCRIWTPSGRREVRDAGKIAVLEDLRGIFPKDADVKSGDRITIENRRGVQLYGSMAGRTGTQRRGAQSSSGHLEFSLTRHA